MTTSLFPTAPLTRSQERALRLRPSALAPGGRVYGPVMAAALAAAALPDPNAGSRVRRDRVQRVAAAVSGVYGAAEAGAAVRCARLAARRSHGISGSIARPSGRTSSRAAAFENRTSPSGWTTRSRCAARIPGDRATQPGAWCTASWSGSPRRMSPS